MNLLAEIERHLAIRMAANGTTLPFAGWGERANPNNSSGHKIMTKRIACVAEGHQSTCLIRQPMVRGNVGVRMRSPKPAMALNAREAAA
ncbi:MAG TPA: hypothetical protein PKC03_14890 [Dokdonella sp.]|nr:hypothetical protein [Dokdonella sp.]